MNRNDKGKTGIVMLGAIRSFIKRIKLLRKETKQRIVVYSLLVLFLLPLIPSYIFEKCEMESSLLMNFGCLIGIISVLKLLLEKYPKIVLLIEIPLLLFWSVGVSSYLIFMECNTGGLDIENFFHLTHVSEWVEGIWLVPWQVFYGIFLIVLFVVFSHCFSIVLAWAFHRDERTKFQVGVYGLGFVVFLIFFLFCELSPVRQFAALVMQVRAAKKYYTLDSELYKANGVNITPLSWTDIRAGKGINLVYIILESTENTYLDQKKFPGLLPNLCRFERQAQSFTNISQSFRANITFSAIYSAMMGSYVLPLHLNRYAIDAWNVNIGSQFSSLSKILNRAGYTQCFLVGHSGIFGGTETFAKEQKYDIFWSAMDRSEGDARLIFSKRDSAVFQQGWKMFQELSGKNVPFNITMLTLDAHGPDGFYSPDEPPYPHQKNPPLELYNAMYASDHALGKLLRNIMNHPNGKNTCIVIMTDHLAPTYIRVASILKTNPNRRLLLLIENSKIKSFNPNVEGRTFDVGPTILDAMGVSHNYKFPLGESLYGETDRRRLVASKEQQKAINVYTLMKSSEKISLPYQLSLNVQPFPLLHINSQKHPLLFNSTNDIPKTGEALVLRVYKKSFAKSFDYFPNKKAFEKFLKDYSGNLIILGNGQEFQFSSEKTKGSFFLACRINGKIKVVRNDNFQNLKITYDPSDREFL